jgi:hypothetical protein
MLVGKLQADPSVDWISDSLGSFDVLLTGNGLGWSGTLTSPSGLWSLSSDNLIEYPFIIDPDAPTPLVSVENVGEATFLGQLSSQYVPPNPSDFPLYDTASIGSYGGYSDYFSPTAPINDGNNFSSGYLSEYGWSGSSTISITSIPNINDVSTWTWTAQYTASGPGLIVPVSAPEPTTIAVFSFFLSVAFIFLKRQKHRNFPDLR